MVNIAHVAVSLVVTVGKENVKCHSMRWVWELLRKFSISMAVDRELRNLVVPRNSMDFISSCKILY